MAKRVRELQKASKKSQSVRDRMHARQKKKMCLVSWEKIGRKNREKMRSGQLSSQYCTGGGTPGKGTCTKSTEETGRAA